MITIEAQQSVSSSGRRYINSSIEKEELYFYINKLKELLGEEYKEYNAKRKERSGNKYHITIIGPNEYSESHASLIGKEIEVELIGLGKASSKENVCYFVVVNSNDIHKIREESNLYEKDLHITLGFYEEDVHGVDKSELSII